jgi:signal transduction histidine kinase
MSAAAPRGRGLRRDAPILLPASLLLFATLASITLLSYRSAIARLTAEREQRALQQAVALADAARLLKTDEAGSLARWLPPGSALAIYDGRGAVRWGYGFTGPDAAALPTPRAGDLTAPRVQSLGSDASGMVRVWVPFDRAGQRLLLRLDSPEATLFSQQRSLRILTPVVFGLCFAVSLLAVFFLRALVRPYEALLEKARAVAPAKPDGGARGAAGPQGAARGSDEEVDFLLATFDRALAALRSESGRGAGGSPGHDEALGELSAVERTLGPQLESGLMMFDREGRLLAANPAAEELLGPLRPRLGFPAGEALAAHPDFASLAAAAIADGRSIPRASVGIERGGQKVELGLTLQTLRGTAGAAGPAFLVLFADVTDLSRREAEERFAAGLAQLGELSAGVAHELRNSLATVQGYLALAARRELPEAAREELAEARRETQALARIVDDFLTFARPGSGVLEPVDLGVLLARATSDPALAGVDFELMLPKRPLPAIAGDPSLLQRALRNLLLNAAQATLAHASTAAPAGPVVVTLSQEAPPAGALRIAIDDCGTGLAPEVAAHLFEPFASGRPGGAGLGLALARRIVVMHGGSLSVAPREPLGVRAEIRLPPGNIAT